MKKLTITQFNSIRCGGIIAKGVLPNSPDGIHMTFDGGDLKWIAVKGWGNDWAIYCHWAYHTDEYVLSSGDKVTLESNIKRCVPCNKPVFKLYRY
jgi:hypothetical protein